MLWIERNAAIGRVGRGQLLEDPHRVEPAQSAAADLLASSRSPPCPSLGGRPQHVDGEVLVRIPLQRVRRNAFRGERRRRLGDDALVVVHLEQLGDNVATSSWG